MIVTVLGAGSWGTALAHLARRNGHEVRLWTRDESVAAQLKSDGANARYLPGVSLSDIEIGANLWQSLRGAQWIVSAVPCAGVPDLVPEVAKNAESGATLISGTKGLHPQSGARAAQMWGEGFDKVRYAALSGPNLAREIALGVPTSSVIASADDETAIAAQEIFTSTLFRVYTNVDLIGVELGGALKNVVAIAAGVCDGLGFGDNAKAAIMTRHWREMTRLAVAQGASESTLFGLSGVGDLFATCASPHSRNHSLGTKIGRGESLQQAQNEVAQVAEGVHTTRAALRLSKTCGVELPVTEQLAALLFEGQSVQNAVESLMGRQGCAE
ncbi:glycerol 3-phosphate dehydrogenase (NAD(P)+) [Abditibacterium utsteinense]|uniref:Glycerol-3-phosphate dehydrogenase [NAD(P)+] n=1 Tax=Abditibacterium utsteinense TaxID=1960156 RepID=A0A2S8SQC2_9BACT|nr:NAD(P)H-dependent glycerol-3-phosphate dehydrogenase [Abditibacterium utsteinense]PQV62986.1 glycerol 3-phosphate dehydrogenase (NAD(P)+) [Abditibacterium utsteinense]